MNTINRKELIKNQLNHCINNTSIIDAPKTKGKVRDVYDLKDNLLFVTTDRLSAFDRNLTTIPFKGEVLNQLSAFWFEKLKHIVPNHMLSLPAPNMMKVKKLNVFPIEFVVRAYITGSTNTSMWTLYQNGQRQFSDLTLEEDLKKNAKLPRAILTPTTKAVAGDKPIEADEIVKQNFMSQSDFDKASKIALKIFNHASEVAKSRGLILVDTKFEMAKDSDGNIVLVDEVLTPDSSRYWRLSNYQERLDNQLEPDNFDKEIIRAWYKKRCDPYKDKAIPEAPDELRAELAETYICLYEKITNQTFEVKNEKLDSSLIN